MHDESSIQRQWRRDQAFCPPYCPNPRCKNHFKHSARADFFAFHSVKVLKRFPYLSHRFRCLDCEKTFCPASFQLHYRQKVWGLNEQIEFLHSIGASKRAIARRIGHDEKLVRVRLKKMARWSLLFHAKKVEDLPIQEPIVYDGLENFSFSQYDPNNVNHAVGKTSLFTYDFNFCPLNRKGRMSPRQRARKKALEKIHGPYPRDAIRTTTKRVFERLLKKTNHLTLFTDKHFQYRRVVEEDLKIKGKTIGHIKVSSKIHRNYKNHLFAVNNVDMQARHNLAAFKRETIAFSKHSVAMMDSFILYTTHRNYRRPKFWGTHRSDPLSAKKSPAMEVGVETKILSFNEFYKERVMPTQVQLCDDWANQYNRYDPHSRRKILA